MISLFEWVISLTELQIGDQSVCFIVANKNMSKQYEPLTLIRLYKKIKTGLQLNALTIAFKPNNFCD